MEGMEAYPRAAVERAMKVQEVMLRAMARKITWYQAAEILGITDRHLRRWRERYEQFGFDGVLDRRRCKGRGWWRGDASAGCIANGARGGRCRACCCTSTAAAISGFRTSAGTT